jgi:hypothetical protein
MAVVAGHAEAYRWQLNPVERANFIWAGGPMKEKDRLLRRAEKMRRDSLSVRKEASQLTLEIDRQCMMVCCGLGRRRPFPGTASLLSAANSQIVVASIAVSDSGKLHS